MNKETKPKWFKPSIKSTGPSCLCCGQTAEILPLDTKLYWGFSGWNVLKNGKEFFHDDRPVDFDEFKDLAYVESLIGEDDENEYVAQFDGPLRDAKYQRHTKNTWVLIHQGPGFA